MRSIYVFLFVIVIGKATSDQSMKESDKTILRKFEELSRNMKVLYSIHNRQCFPCKPIIEYEGKICDCTEFRPKQDCRAFREGGFKVNGLFRLKSTAKFNYLMAYCDQTTMGGGWTVIQRRQDGSVDFNERWHGYKMGFGSITGEFWFGNENIHELTKLSNAPKNTELLIVMRMKGKTTTEYAKYNDFILGDEKSKYSLKMKYGGFSGNTSYNALVYNKDMKFSTIDSDNSVKRCVVNHGGGWWSKDCYESFLNGPYKFSGAHHPRIYWFIPKFQQPEFVEMKIRRIL